MSEGDFSVFVTRPICLSFLIIAVVTLFLPIVGPKLWDWWKRRSGRPVLPENETRK